MEEKDESMNSPQRKKKKKDKSKKKKKDKKSQGEKEAVEKEDEFTPSVLRKGGRFSMGGMTLGPRCPICMIININAGW